MKKYFFTCLGVLAISCGMAQQPVKWTCEAKKISEKVYEVHLKASIQDGWHLYAQEQPENFIGSPTTIKFNKNPLLVFSGKTEEIGKLEKRKEPTLGTEAWQYRNEVVFVQNITLRNNSVKTRIGGSVEFQVCTNEKCLPPATTSFSLAINQ